MKILVIGSGGREHTITWKLRQDNPSASLFCCPGNGGTAAIATPIPLSEKAVAEVAEFAARQKIDLTVVGPEVPLALGVTDAFAEKRLPVFGPARRAAQLESSKVFAKEFMRRHKIPTADYVVAASLTEAQTQLRKHGAPCVIKYDGLAAGKGVRVVGATAEGESFLEDIFLKHQFGPEPHRVVIEDCLSGREVSYLVITDGRTFLPLETAQDYKRAQDGDRGQNTGGMGTYSPSRFFPAETRAFVHERVVEPTLAGLRKDAIPYTGVIYFGLMLTAQGPSLLEYNVRFGDPETQVILPRLETPLAEVLQAAAEGCLERVALRWRTDHAVCVVLASAGYPAAYRTGLEITGLADVTDALVFHSGTRAADGRIYTAGGRVLGVVGLAPTLAEARRKAYTGADLISFEGKNCRRDIADFSTSG